MVHRTILQAAENGGVSIGVNGLKQTRAFANVNGRSQRGLHDGIGGRPCQGGAGADPDETESILAPKLACGEYVSLRTTSTGEQNPNPGEVQQMDCSPV